MKKQTSKLKWLIPASLFIASAITIMAGSINFPGTRNDDGQASTIEPKRKADEKPSGTWIKDKPATKCCDKAGAEHVCVIKTILGIEKIKPVPVLITNPMVKEAVRKGMDWIAAAQLADGGWGAGSHDMQHVRDPHAVKSDPATTSLVGMSLLRNDNSFTKGKYSASLKKGAEFLLKAVESCPDGEVLITNLKGTQPQIKLGQNIDVILTAQFFTNLLRYDMADDILKKRIEKALDKCIARIQLTQSDNGGWLDGGWAPILQSALANNALESAEDVGRNVNADALRRSRDYQTKNFDTETQSVVTGDASGVLLYSLSSSTRASAKDAKKAQEFIVKAKKEGKIEKDAVVTEETLVKSGLSETEARNYATAYKVNSAAQAQAVREDVMAGFGNNGGEEFLSFLMTGESILMQGGDSFKKWYEMMSGKLVEIQNNDGSWNGHHCITSPVFCTATCLLILSIHNDMQFSIEQHQQGK